MSETKRRDTAEPTKPIQLTDKNASESSEEQAIAADLNVTDLNATTSPSEIEASDDTTTTIKKASPPARPFIVAVGASAGGLEALQAFFDPWPADTGLAFIVVQHLSPDFKSVMVELLARHTKIKILQATDGAIVEPNSIYLIPPANNLTVEDGQLRLASQQRDGQLNLPIDILFGSLARWCKGRMAGVVLSGTGSDGARGIQEIKQADGLVVAQTEDSAKFDGMPRSAVDTGCVDMVLPPEAMADAILRYIKHPMSLSHSQRNVDLLLSESTKLEQVINLLKRKQGVDFSTYKPSTASRRIARRMVITGLEEVEDYLDKLRESNDEAGQLVTDMLIGVTSFFRDPDVWQHVGEVMIPSILSMPADTDDAVRIWIPGCSTGQEAYTVAILFSEQMEALSIDRQLKIFATDLNQNAINIASAGIYDESLVQDLSPARLRLFFTRLDDGRYEISRKTREKIVFARHDVLRDAPFGKIDFITCRNLLIYIRQPAQSKIIQLFHHALKPEGHLLLGSSESIDQMGRLRGAFDSIDEARKTFKKNQGVSFPVPVDKSVVNLAVGLQRPITMSMSLEPKIARTALERATRFLTDTYSPPAVLVNGSYDILHTFGNLGEILDFPKGNYSSQLGNMVYGNLRVAVLGALNRSKKSRESVSFNDLEHHREDGSIRVDVTVNPLMHEQSGESDVFLVFFNVSQPIEQLAPSTKKTAFSIEDEKDIRIQGLEDQLQTLKENLQATVEELETSNEELQATNEELVAANEELQSTNEELHSVNEELYSVNAEYQQKIVELTDVTNDYDNLLVSTQIGVVFVDEQLSIRKFTPEAQGIVNLRNNDIGRPLNHITHEIIDFDLADTVKQTIVSEASFSQDIQLKSGKWILLKTHPFHTSEEKVTGAVITLVDVDDLERSRAHLQTILEASPVALSLIDTDGVCLLANRASAIMLGCDSVGELIEKNIYEVNPGLRNHKHVHDSVFSGEERDIPDLRLPHFPNKYFHSRYRPVKDKADRVIGLVVAVSDITDSKEREIEISHHEARSSALLGAIPDDFFRISPKGKIIDASISNSSLGFVEHDIVGQLISTVFHSDLQPYIDGVFSNSDSHTNAKNLCVFDVEYAADNGDAFIIEGRLSRISADEAVLITRNVTDQRHHATMLEERKSAIESEIKEHQQTTIALTEAKEELHNQYADITQLFSLSRDSIVFLDENGSIRRANPAFCTQVGILDADSSSSSFEDFVVESHQQKIRDMLKTARTTGRAAEEAQINGQNGPRWFSFHAARKDTEMIYVIGRDTSERRLYESKLKNEEERIRLALSASRAGWWDWHLEEDSIKMSVLCLAPLGINPTDEPIKNAMQFRRSLIHPMDLPRVESMLNAHWRGDVPLINVEYRALSKNGGYRWVHDHGAVVDRDAENKPMRMVGTLRDIQDRKSLEDLNEANARELKRSNEALQQFVHIAAHDLKAPLRAIKNMSTLLEERTPFLDDESQKYLNIMISRSDRMSQFLDGLLAYSKVGQSNLNATEIDPRMRIEQLVEHSAPNDNVNVDIKGRMPRITTEVTPFDQTMGNLINNAFKYSSPGSSVRIESLDEGDYVRFSVADDGPGIAPEYHGKIFDLFETVEARDAGGGTGLGLAIAKRAVKSVGGQIGVISELGKGSTFYFTWPKSTDSSRLSDGKANH